MNRANFVSEITVIDPDWNAPVEVAIYKDSESGAMFGVESSYVMTLSEDDPVNNPFNGKEIKLIKGSEIKS